MQNENVNTSGAIWLTDVNDMVLSRCRDNVQLPCSKSLPDISLFKPNSILSDLSSSYLNINYCSLDWSAALGSSEALPLGSILHDEIKANLILGADLVGIFVRYSARLLNISV